MAIDPITGHYYVPYVSSVFQTTSADSASTALEESLRTKRGFRQRNPLTQARGSTSTPSSQTRSAGTGPSLWRISKP